MSKVFLPTSEQMDTTLENLSRIAGALGTRADTSTWAGIQRVVKAGDAPRLFPIGTQFTVPHSVYGDRVYDVVAHDYFKSVADENAHTMTLMCHDQIGAIQFDDREAFYYAEKELPAGIYSIILVDTYGSWVKGTYQFTLTKALPAGGQLCLDGGSDGAMTIRKVRAYESRTTTEVSETATITSGNAGTSLGTFGKELNHVHRVSYGSNNYKESAIRQFLNSLEQAGSVWTPQTKFDRPPSWVNSTAGFMNGLDSEFLDIVGKVIVPCVTNNTYESLDSATVKGEKYTVTDRFYIASHREIFGMTTDAPNDDSILFPYYESSSNADRIKYKQGSPALWWLRSTSLRYSAIVRAVNSDGSANDYYGAVTSNGCVPVCTIV